MQAVDNALELKVPPGHGVHVVPPTAYVPVSQVHTRRQSVIQSHECVSCQHANAHYTCRARDAAGHARGVGDGATRTRRAVGQRGHVGELAQWTCGAVSGAVETRTTCRPLTCGTCRARERSGRRRVTCINVSTRRHYELEHLRRSRVNQPQPQCGIGKQGPSTANSWRVRRITWLRDNEHNAPGRQGLHVQLTHS